MLLSYDMTSPHLSLSCTAHHAYHLSYSFLPEAYQSYFCLPPPHRSCTKYIHGYHCIMKVFTSNTHTYCCTLSTYPNFTSLIFTGSQTYVSFLLLYLTSTYLFHPPPWASPRASLPQLFYQDASRSLLFSTIPCHTSTHYRHVRIITLIILYLMTYNLNISSHPSFQKNSSIMIICTHPVAY